MTPKDEYEYRINNRTPKELEKADKYNCDGLCYGCHFMCPRADYCEETRFKEGISTIFAIISIIFTYIIFIVTIILLIFIDLK